MTQPTYSPEVVAQLEAVRPTRSPWLTRDEVAERLRLPKSTLEGWVCEGKGPRFAKFGKHVRYRLADVEAWEDEQFGVAS